MNDKARAIMRVLAGVVMGLLGITLALITNDVTGPVGILGQSLGLSLIVTGSVTIFQEAVLNPLRRDEFSEQINRISYQTKENFETVFSLMRRPGIYMISPERRGSMRYYKWLLERSPQKIFFAGHSVLHRIQSDFDKQGLVPVYEALRQKVAEGSKVQILFLDPTWDYLDKVARDEGQESTKLRTDLAESLGLCKKLWGHIETEKYAGEIEIRMCSALKQYAFHRVSCSEKSEDEVLVGFYFAGRLGMKSPLFAVEDEQIQEFFIEHFTNVFEKSEILLSYSREFRDFDHSYYRKCRDALAQHIEEKVLIELCP